MIEFKDVDGWKRFITLLGIQPSGQVDALVYDGKPHYVSIAMSDLLPLRVTHIETMGPVDVAMYRCELGLDPWPAEIEIAA